MKLFTIGSALGILSLAVGVSGCNSLSGLTTAQKAQIFCVIAADGTAIATASTTGAANAAAVKAGNASVVACQGATQIGQIVTPVPAATAAVKP